MTDTWESTPFIEEAWESQATGITWATVFRDGGAGGGGAVDSVNGQTGVVVLDAGDVGALPDDTVIPDITGLQATSEKNQPNGYAGLDGDGTIPDNRIPSSIARDTEIGTQITAHDGSGTAHATLFAGKVSTSAIDTDSSLAADSDTRVPSQKAVKAHVATKQPLDSDLTAIAALTPANDDFIQRKAGAWTHRTVAQVKADLGVGGPAGFYEDNVYHGLLGHIHGQFSGGGTGLVVGANLLVLWRIMPIETVDVDGFTLMVQVDGGSGGLARVGIFPASTSTTEPTGTPVVESGNLNVNVGAGTTLTDTFTSGRLTAYTPYWGAFVTNSASLSVRYLAGAQNTQSAAMESGAVSSADHRGRRVAHTFGALPPSPAAPFNNNVTQLPGVLWRTQRI